MSDEDWKKREEELRQVPPRTTDRSAWPSGVRPIGVDEMDALGVDAKGMLYWHGKSVAIRRIELGSWELWLAVLATLGTLLSGLAAMFPLLPSIFSGH
jgi:hypothetical protein